MIIQFLNQPTSSRYRQRVELDNREYVVIFTWRERSNGWYVTIFDADDESTIVEGRRLRKYANATQFVDELDGYFATGQLGRDDFEPFYAHDGDIE